MQRRGHRHQRAVMGTVVAMVMVVVVAGCASGSKSPSAGTSATSGPTTTGDSNAIPPVTATATTEALKALLVDPGTGFTALPESGDGAGPIDLGRAAQDSPTGEPGPLTQAGFLGGYQGRWQHTDGRQLLVSVYEFRDPSGPAQILTASQANPGFQASPHFVVEPIPGALGTLTTGAGVASVAFARGPYLVNIVGFASPDAVAQALATQIAVGQYVDLGP
ncbi:MAG TPA: hypothetical protein VIJ47_16230 [Acidimicrobiales bacterium]